MEKEVNGFPYHTLTPNEIFKKLSSQKEGLSSEKAKIFLEKFGTNELKEKKTLNPVFVFLKQFNSFFVYILLIAVVISFFIKNFIDMYVIIAVILINSSIGFFQEFKAERSISALKKMIVLYAKVYRDSELLKIPASQLVPGDIILLEEGDKIPADARLIELKNFTTVESSLTGESLPIMKKLEILKKDITLADRTNMVWMGTFAASGMGKAVVVGTNDNTAIGLIARDISEIKKEKSHFGKKTDILAIEMGIIAIISSLLVFLIGYFIRGFGFIEILVFTIASLVSAIPEGLPAILAIVLAVGAFRMAKRKAIIRRLPATETLAVVNTIISDKTGTLTQNTMTVRKILLPGEKEIIVGGEGWEPKGDFKQGKGFISPLENVPLAKLLHISSVCNNSTLLKETNEENKEENYKIMGDPTEAALRVLAEKGGLKEDVVGEKEKRIDDMPFNQKLRYRASLSCLKKPKKKQIYIVGAPEIVLRNSSEVFKLNTIKKLTELDRKAIEKQINSLTMSAMRVIAFAMKDVPDNVEEFSESLTQELTFIGMVGIIDPPRPEVKEAIAKANQSGIRIIMATGDHKNTAVAIAKEIGLRIGNSPDFPDVLTEEELGKLNEKEFEKAIKNVNLFARLTPHMKLKIASTLQKRGDIVAMTGDGVNDAPALKQSDIGIAMGVIGTDVARESAEVVLADDNFASIINAIEEAHIVFSNTRQTSFFLLSTNFAESITLVTTLLAGFPLPLLPTQILWLNLITDTGSGLGLAMEPSHNGLEEEKPKNPKENILTKEVVPFVVLMSIMMVFLTVMTFAFFFSHSLDKARTGAFIIMALTQLFNTFNMRSLKKSVFKIGLFSNKYLNILLVISFVLLLCILYIPFFQGIFHFTTLGFLEFLILLALSSLILWFGEGYKKMKRLKKN